MAGTLTVDTIQSDSSYASTLNVASKINFTSGMQIGGQDTTFGGMRNRIINGDMRIDQRNAGAAVTYSAAEAVYNVDRWQAGAIGGGTFTTRQMNSANTSASNYEASSSPTGFTNSLKITVGTADTSLASSDRYSIYQYIEGYNVQDLDFGIATAKTVTVSFWTKSSVVGTYGVWLSNAAYNRSAVNTFTINVANTWEYKTLTFVGDITGTWIKDNGPGLHLGIQLSSGSGYYTSSTNTWAATAYFTTSGQTNFMASSGSTFYITGVQLEKGSAASAFENRQYGTELALCQRYFYRPQQNSSTLNGGIGYAIATGTTTYARAQVPLPVTMRTVPTVAISNVHMYNPASGGGLVATFSDNYSTPDMLSFDGSSSGTTSPSGGSLLLYLNGSTGQLSATAEL